MNQIDQVREKILGEMEQEPVPLSRGGEIQDEQGGMQPDTIPLSSTKISSPLKGALAADSIPVPLSRGCPTIGRTGVFPGCIPPLSFSLSSPLERGTGAVTVSVSASSAPFKGLLTSVERWGMVKGTGSSNTDTVTLFTHGRLEAGKGIDVLVKTFQRMNNEEMKKMKNGGIVSDSPLQISPEI